MTPSKGAEAQSRNVLVFSSVFLPGFKAGGPIKSLVEILDRLPTSVRCLVVTADRDLGDTKPYPELSGRRVPRGHHEVVYLNVRRILQWRALSRWIRKNPVDLLYVNSLWSPTFTLVPVLGHLLGRFPAKGVLLAPRGELSPGALRLKRRRKSLVLAIWAPILKRVNPWFQASTTREEREIKNVFPWARTIIQANTPGSPPLERAIPSRDRPRFVFLSRISRMKNLDFAIRALRLVEHDLEFRIFGPTAEPRYWRKCQDLVAKLPGHIEVHYEGPVPNGQSIETFAQFDAFILPTLGENFGHVIIESLAAGCPVVCSTHSPWSDLLDSGAGVALESLDERVWAHEIDARAAQTASERTAAKNSVLDRYSAWRRQAGDPLAVEVALGFVHETGDA